MYQDTPKDGNGQPLKPVDQFDPTKGYEYQIFQQIQVQRYTPVLRSKQS